LRAGPAGRVIAFEPTAGSASVARRHIAFNTERAAPVTLVEAAVGDSAARTTFYEYDQPYVNSLAAAVDVDGRPTTRSVDVVTIDGKRYGVVLDYKTGKTSKFYAKQMMDGVDLQLRLYLLVLERFWGITPVGAVYLGLGDGVRRGALRGEYSGKFAGIEEGPVELLSPDEWNVFVGETPRLIAELVNRLVTFDVRPAPRDKDCGLCDKQPICRYDRWAPTEPSFRAEPRSGGPCHSERRPQAGGEES